MAARRRNRSSRASSSLRWNTFLSKTLTRSNEMKTFAKWGAAIVVLALLVGWTAPGQTARFRHNVEFLGNSVIDILGTWKISGTTVAATATQLDYTIVTPGAVSANKALVVDSSSQIGLVDVSALGGLKTQGTTVTIPITLFLEGTLGNNTGADADGVLIGQITLSDVICKVDDGTVFSTDTTDCNSVGNADVSPLPAVAEVNDAFYVGHATKQFTYVWSDSTDGTQGVTTQTLAFEYYNGTSWVTLTSLRKDIVDFDETVGAYYNAFAPPSDWATVAVDSVTGYWVRWRVTAFTSSGTDPVLDQVQIGLGDTGIGLNMASPGKIVAVSFTASTQSATNTDSTFLLINQTASTTTVAYSVLTFTAGEQMDRHDITDLTISAGDDIVLQQIGEDGTTENADVQAILELEL